MHFARRLYEAQELERQDRERVVLVGDVRELHVRIDVVRECLVADTREAVAHGADGDGRGEVEWEVDSIEEGEDGACG